MTSRDQNTSNGALPSIVNPPHLHDPTLNGYSTAVVSPAAGRLAFISRQGGQDKNGYLSPEFGNQLEQAYSTLAAVLDALGALPKQIVKLTVFVVDHDMSKLGVPTENLKRMFGETLPAQTLIPVPKLAIDPMLFEVEAVLLLD